jgi:Tfp pilus assembly protein PilO
MKFLLPLILIIAAVAGFYFYVNPEYAKVKALQQERDEYIAAVEQAEEAAEKLNDLVAEWNGYTEQEMERLKRLLPDNVDSIRMLIDIQSVARESNLRLENVQIRGAAGASQGQAQAQANVGAQTPMNNRVVPYSFAFTVNTTYEIFQNFLADLEKSLQLVTVDTLVLGPTDEKTGTRPYQVSFSTFSLKR